MGYPEAGGTLRWSSTPAGRGTVTERVVEHESRRLHRVEYEDPETTGQLSVTFAIEGEGTMVTQELDYRLRDRGVFAQGDRPPVHPLADARVPEPLARPPEARGGGSGGRNPTVSSLIAFPGAKDQ